MRHAPHTHPLRADLLMLGAALIWGCSFVVQRLSLATIGPLLFTGVRFLLGACIVALMGRWLRDREGADREDAGSACRASLPWRPGAVLGVLVALSISAQQIGLAYTQVANAGFISAMYVVLVPLFSMLAGHRLRFGIIAGALCAAMGLYFLSGERLTLQYGDALELFGAVAIALQLILMGMWVHRHDALTLAWIQNLVCGLICLAAAFAFEPVHWSAIQNSLLAILYCGGLSVGLGYGIQAIAQRDALPSHAAIIFSTEGVFAALAARVFIREHLSWQAIVGCCLVVLGCLVSQLATVLRRRSGSSHASSPISGRNEHSL